MDQQKPEYFRPALIVGAVAGLLSGIPFFSLFNCVCCLWIVAGAAMATRLLARNSFGSLTSGDGAIVGALTGIVAAVVHTMLTLAFKPDVETARRVLDWLSSIGFEKPSNIDGLLEKTSGLLSPGFLLLGLFVTAAIYALMGVLGGIIGISIFAKKNLQAPPPAAPPSAPQVPRDAA